MKKRTVYTIAQELNLSPSTISKVINGTGHVSKQTRERVLDHIKAVGYVPTQSARILKSKRTYTIGVIFSEDSNVGLEHSFFSSILQHFKSYVESHGYELSFIVRRLGQHSLSYYEWCRNKRVDGVYIVVGDYQDQALIDLIHSDIPCISNDMLLPKLDTVISDNDQGIKIIFDYIKEVIKKDRLGFICGSMLSKAFNERLDAYHKYVKAFGFEESCDNVVVADGFGFTTGYQAAEQLLKKDPKIEVLMVSSDEIALGVLKYLSDQGIHVPNDIQVIGFDDINFAKHFTPALTTVAQDRKNLGETAAKQLIAMIESDHKFEEIVKLPVELIVRNTTKAKEV